jgi:hypothetical protein
MTREGVDYSTRTVDVRALRAAGKTFAMRYLSHDDGKNLHADEARQLSSAGIDIGVVWETSAQRTLSGRAGGVQDAQEAARQAKACGMPDDRPIYFAVDFDANDRQKPTIADYLRGAASVLGANRVGVYGGFPVVKYCFDHGVAKYAWQTLAWSGGHRDPRAQLYQHRNGVKVAGMDVDLDTAFAEDFGQWRTGGGGHGSGNGHVSAPAFPYPAREFLALRAAGAHAHWGKDAAEQANVKRWQAQMAKRGWRVKATGTFDAASDQVCRKFQAEKGLDKDGKVGPATWSATWTTPVT